MRRRTLASCCVAHAIKQDHPRIHFRTVDTDVVVAVVMITQPPPLVNELRIAYGTSKNYRHILARKRAASVGQRRHLPFLFCTSWLDTTRYQYSWDMGRNLPGQDGTFNKSWQFLMRSWLSNQSVFRMKQSTTSKRLVYCTLLETPHQERLSPKNPTHLQRFGTTCDGISLPVGLFLGASLGHKTCDSITNNLGLAANRRYSYKPL